MPPTVEKKASYINPSESKKHVPPMPGDIFASVRGPSEIEFGFISHVAFYGTRGDGTREWGAIIFSGRAEVATLNHGQTWYGESDWHPATPEELALFGTRLAAGDDSGLREVATRVAVLFGTLERHDEAIVLHGGELAVQGGKVEQLEKENEILRQRCARVEHIADNIQKVFSERLDGVYATVQARIDEMQAALDDATKANVRIVRAEEVVPEATPAVPAPGGPPASLGRRPRVGAPPVNGG